MLLYQYPIGLRESTVPTHIGKALMDGYPIANVLAIGFYFDKISMISSGYLLLSG